MINLSYDIHASLALSCIHLLNVLDSLKIDLCLLVSEKTQSACPLCSFSCTHLLPTYTL